LFSASRCRALGRLTAAASSNEGGSSHAGSAGSGYWLYLPRGALREVTEMLASWLRAGRWSAGWQLRSLVISAFRTSLAYELHVVEVSCWKQMEARLQRKR